MNIGYVQYSQPCGVAMHKTHYTSLACGHAEQLSAGHMSCISIPAVMPQLVEALEQES